MLKDKYKQILNDNHNKLETIIYRELRLSIEAGWGVYISKDTIDLVHSTILDKLTDRFIEVYISDNIAAPEMVIDWYVEYRLEQDSVAIFKQLTQGAKDQHNEYIIDEINQIKEAYKNAQLNYIQLLNNY